mmetsp:Transcript_46266/g.144720  ORF Transcript_46266/g.144720 Transcript_46266/m.144720 type:complete len:508 (+) Transcript_46266:319-1842(+)
MPYWRFRRSSGPRPISMLSTLPPPGEPDAKPAAMAFVSCTRWAKACASVEMLSASSSARSSAAAARPMTTHRCSRNLSMWCLRMKQAPQNSFAAMPSALTGSGRQSWQRRTVGSTPQCGHVWGLGCDRQASRSSCRFVLGLGFFGSASGACASLLCSSAFSSCARGSDFASCAAALRFPLDVAPFPLGVLVDALPRAARAPLVLVLPVLAALPRSEDDAGSALLFDVGAAAAAWSLGAGFAASASACIIWRLMDSRCQRRRLMVSILLFFCESSSSRSNVRPIWCSTRRSCGPETSPARGPTPIFSRLLSSRSACSSFWRSMCSSLSGRLPDPDAGPRFFWIARSRRPFSAASFCFSASCARAASVRSMFGSVRESDSLSSDTVRCATAAAKPSAASGADAPSASVVDDALASAAALSDLDGLRMGLCCRKRASMSSDSSDPASDAASPPPRGCFLPGLVPFVIAAPGTGRNHSSVRSTKSSFSGDAFGGGASSSPSLNGDASDSSW